MIYIISGNDIKSKNVYLKKLLDNEQPFFITQSEIVKELLFDYAKRVSLFGESPFIVMENVLKEGSIEFSAKDFLTLKESKTKFIFLEEKLLAVDIKKYEKYATIENFNTEALKQIPKINIFNIADNFARKDKIGTWVIYREAVLLGIPPEEISGIIFWKIKTMLLSGTKFFSQDELKQRSSNLVSLYHKAHLGELDFIIGLEQFILSSLSK